MGRWDRWFSCLVNFIPCKRIKHEMRERWASVVCGCMYSIQDRHGKAVSHPPKHPRACPVSCSSVESWKPERAEQSQRVVWRTGKGWLKRLKQLRLALIKENLRSDLVIISIQGNRYLTVQQIRFGFLTPGWIVKIWDNLLFSIEDFLTLVILETNWPIFLQDVILMQIGFNSGKSYV